VRRARKSESGWSYRATVLSLWQDRSWFELLLQAEPIYLHRARLFSVGQGFAGMDSTLDAGTIPRSVMSSASGSTRMGRIDGDVESSPLWKAQFSLPQAHDRLRLRFPEERESVGKQYRGMREVWSRQVKFDWTVRPQAGREYKSGSTAGQNRCPT
jgi:hypothetical protein